MDNISYARGWLRAFLDGEGSVPVSNRCIDFASTEPCLIEEAKRYLALLGIKSRSYESPRKPPRKAIIHLRIRRKDDVRRFIEEVGSSVPYKRANMDELLSFFDRPGQKRNRWWDSPPPSDVLRDMLNRGMKRREIADALGLSIHMITTYARHYGLHRPKRSGPEPDPEVVRKAYWEEGLSLIQLSERFGYSGTSVVRLLERHNIPRRKPEHKIVRR